MTSFINSNTGLRITYICLSFDETVLLDLVTTHLPCKIAELSKSLRVHIRYLSKLETIVTFDVLLRLSVS